MKRMLLFLGFVIVAALVTQAQNQAANQKNDTAGPKPSTAQSQSVSGQTSQSGQSKGVNQDEHKPSQHHMHWHFAPFISAGYAHFSGPLFYGAFWPYGFYPATFPYAGDFYPYGFYYPANTFDYHEGRGQVKLSGASTNKRRSISTAPTPVQWTTQKICGLIRVCTISQSRASRNLKNEFTC